MRGREEGQACPSGWGWEGAHLSPGHLQPSAPRSTATPRARGAEGLPAGTAIPPRSAQLCRLLVWIWGWKNQASCPQVSQQNWRPSRRCSVDLRSYTTARLSLRGGEGRGGAAWVWAESLQVVRLQPATYLAGVRPHDTQHTCWPTGLGVSPSWPCSTHQQARVRPNGTTYVLCGLKRVTNLSGNFFSKKKIKRGKKKRKRWDKNIQK